ncbi:isochorismatase family protein [bacterium BMS3Abin14]|nr:isochorismatase family protein [bacterium BMS3Abin14]
MGEKMRKKMKLNTSDMVLLVVDVQERLAKVMERRDQVVKTIGVLMKLAELLNFPVVHTQQYTRGLGPTVEPLATALRGVDHVEKIHFSCCGEGEFVKRMDALGRRTVLLTGMETHICVLQTALDLMDMGYNVHVPWDAVCSRSDGNRDWGIRFMERGGAIITSSETAAFQLLGRSGTPQFKEISSLLK